LRIFSNPTEPGNSPSEVISTLEGITERKQMEAELIRAKQAADEANRAKGDFEQAHSLVHNLKGLAGNLEAKDLHLASPLPRDPPKADKSPLRYDRYPEPGIWKPPKSLSSRNKPPKAWKPGVIAVERDPFATGLDGQSRKPGIRYKVAARVCFGAKAFKNLPVSFARLNDDAVGLIENDVAESEYLIQATGHPKYFRVGCDADHTAQNLRRHTVTRIAVDHAVKPGPTGFMFGRICAKGMHKDVDIGEDHGALMTSSKSLDRFRSTPGRTPPDSLDTGNSTLFRRRVFGFDRISAKPSSTSDVRVHPSSAACFLARFRRSSFILIVVLMHQYITLMHQYVKQMNFGALENMKTVKGREAFMALATLAKDEDTAVFYRLCAQMMEAYHVNVAAAIRIWNIGGNLRLQWVWGSGQRIISIFIYKHPRNRCFQQQYRPFQGQNRLDKLATTLEAEMPPRPQRPVDNLL
jgi:hypothetical protein